VRAPAGTGLALGLAAAVLGCGGGVAAKGGADLLLPADLAGGDLSPAALATRGLRFPEPPRLEAVVVDEERRPAVVTAAGAWSWRVRVPAGGRLRAGVGAVAEGAAPGSRTLRAQVALRGAEGEAKVLAVSPAADPAAPRWLDLAAELGPWAGRGWSWNSAPTSSRSRPIPRPRGWGGDRSP
jgi:hypothetical protein